MSKLLDDSVDSPLAYLNGIAANNGYQNVYNRRAEYSLDPADVSQRATVSALYNLPLGRNQKFSSGNAWVNRAIGGFQLNLIAVFQTGTPLTITGANSQANAATRPNFVPGQNVKLSKPNPAEVV